MPGLPLQRTRPRFDREASRYCRFHDFTHAKYRKQLRPPAPGPSLLSAATTRKKLLCFSSSVSLEVPEASSSARPEPPSAPMPAGPSLPRVTADGWPPALPRLPRLPLPPPSPRPFLSALPPALTEATAGRGSRSGVSLDSLSLSVSHSDVR